MQVCLIDFHVTYLALSAADSVTWSIPINGGTSGSLWVSDGVRLVLFKVFKQYYNIMQWIRPIWNDQLYWMGSTDLDFSELYNIKQICELKTSE